LRINGCRNVARRLGCRLAFGDVFYLDRAVSPASDEVTSTAATDASGQHGGVAFTTTHWSVVLEAQGESPVAQEALEKLCRTYWRPIFAFLRRQGIPPEEAEDITQGFFAELLERRSLEAVRKEKGRLRSFLLGGLKYFLANEGRRAVAIKRGKGQRLIPLDELRADDRIEIEPADPMTAEMIYQRRWALTVLERVLSRLKDEYFAADNAALFDSLKELLPGSSTDTALGPFTLFYTLPVHFAFLGTPPGDAGASRLIVGDAANGDSILTYLIGNIPGSCANGDFHVGETDTIIGGTGRYAGARGSFIMDRCLNLVTGETSGTISGTIVVRGH
jgi:RNA polymerase sigma-70 factor (ECF subfamily)